jgi:hypothetical protein
MTWVRLDDTFAEDPRLDAAGPLALALHVAALCYCSRLLTDGKLTETALRRLLPGIDAPDVEAMNLVDAGLWRVTNNGWEILDYTATQPTREKVLRTREERKKAGAVGGRRSGMTRRSKAEAKTMQVASRPREPRPDSSFRGGAARKASVVCKHGRPIARDGSSDSCCDQPAAAVGQQ